MKINAISVLKFLAGENERLNVALLRYGNAAAKKLEAHAKATRPWKDHTGNARQSLRGMAQRDGNRTTIALSGGMEYSPKLELGYGGKYSVIRPTIDALSTEIVNGLSGILNKR